MQEILNQYKGIKSEEDKEMAFLKFKNAKEKKFPWNEEIEFKLFEFILAYEQNKEQMKKELDEKIVVIKTELDYKLSNIKLELETELNKSCKEQDVLIKITDDCYQQLVIFATRKTSIFFKLKSKIVNFFTLGCYNFEKKLINKIEEQKIILQSQEQKFTEIYRKIYNIKKKLSNIEVEIINKQQQLVESTEKFNAISKEINLISSQTNNEVVLATNKLIPSSL